MQPFIGMHTTEMPDHPLRSMIFEGTRRAGLYGAGEVCTWDSGRFETDKDISLALKDGRVIINFYGLKLKGKFEFKRDIDDYFRWKLIKLGDEFADPKSKLGTILKLRNFSGVHPLFEFLKGGSLYIDKERQRPFTEIKSNKKLRIKRLLFSFHSITPTQSYLAVLRKYRKRRGLRRALRK